MSYRVIAGTAKGIRLKFVPGDTTRPIMDRAKEALFNILRNDLYDTTFLDLFAGTGSVGIEALSRGADHAVFLDIERAAVKTIEENLKLTRLADRATVLRQDAFGFLKEIPTRSFDYIYVAPPQYKGMWRRTLEALEANPAWLGESTRVIVQIDPKEQEPILLKHLQETETRRYGQTLLWFFETVIPDDEEQT